MHDLVNSSLNQSIIVRFSKFFFLLKAFKNRQSLKTTGTCPGSPIRSGGPVVWSFSKLSGAIAPLKPPLAEVL